MGPADFTQSGEDQTWCGVLMDENFEQCNDGSFEGVQYFECPPNRGLFCLPKQLSPVESADV